MDYWDERDARLREDADDFRMRQQQEERHGLNADGILLKIADQAGVDPQLGELLRESIGVNDKADAERMRYLLSLPAVKAQAYFWNYTGRRARRQAIDRDMLK